MSKILLFYFLIITALSAHEESLQHEIQVNKTIRSTLRLSAKLAYQDAANIHTDIRPFEAQMMGTLNAEELDKYFHDGANQALPGYKNCFQGGEVRGCIYSIDDQLFKNKIFISFPGTQNMVEWAKNFFGIAPFEHNIQGSYYHDIENIYARRESQAFLNALHKHINYKNSSYRDLSVGDNIPDNMAYYEYYFLGHSRGGGLALIAARKFKEMEEYKELRVKVTTFCMPRIMNAFRIQSEIINLFGYGNIVHFIRPTDLAPRFPFKFVENQGVQIPLQSGVFWNVIDSHRIPSQEELEYSVNQYNTAQGVGWLYPVRHLFTLELKPLLWGVGGFCSAYILIKTDMGTYFSRVIKDIYVNMLRRI